MPFRPIKRSPGFTLIELLLTITIIAILAALLIGPASRALKGARDADWANKAEVRVEDLVKKLRSYYGNAEVKEALSPDRLLELNIIDPSLRQFLSNSRVRFHPFVSDDPDGKVVLEVDVPGSFLSRTGYRRTVKKKRITEE